MWAVACRGDAETRVSGQPYACECELHDSGEEGRVTACASDAGEAIELARSCLIDDGLDVRFCYCDEDSTTWCELGSCTR